MDIKSFSYRIGTFWILCIFSIFQNSALAQINICSTEQLTVSISNEFTSSPYILEFVFESNGVVYGPNSSGIFDLFSLGLSAPSSGVVYAVNHDGNESFATWPVPVSSCLEYLTQTVNIHSCDTLQVCQSGALSVSVSNSNLNAPYVLEYIVSLNGNLYGPNSTGNFSFDSIPSNAADIGIIYAVNHDGNETFATWPIPTDSCVQFIEQVFLVHSSDSTFTSATSCLPSSVGAVTTLFANTDGCDSTHTVLTTLLLSDSTFTSATSCLPSSVGAVTTLFTNTDGCDSTHTVLTTLLLSDSTFTSATSCLPSSVGSVTTLFTNTDGCDSTHTVLTTLITFEVQAFATEGLINQGASISIFAQGDFASSYVWSLSDNTLISSAESFELNPEGTTTIYLLAQEGDCISLDSITISVNSPITLQVPTAFSPNNDGINDAFGIANYYNFESIAMKIYNRWGELIFKADDYNPRWNGTYKNEMQSMDVYIYVLKAKPIDGSNYIETSGNLTLIK